jgi:hypothetical protein
MYRSVSDRPKPGESWYLGATNIQRYTDYLARRCIPPSMGILARRRISILQLLSPYQHTHPIPARTYDLRPRGHMSHLGSVVPYQQCRYECLILLVCREQLFILGHAYILPSGLGSKSIPAWRVLYWPIQHANRVDFCRLLAIWCGFIHVPDRGSESKSYVFISPFSLFGLHMLTLSLVQLPT